MSDNLDPAADLELLAEWGFAESWRSDTRGVDALTMYLMERAR